MEIKFICKELENLHLDETHIFFSAYEGTQISYGYIYNTQTNIEYTYSHIHPHVLNA